MGETDLPLDRAKGYAVPRDASEKHFNYTSEYAPLLSHSHAMVRLRDKIEQVADTDVTVLIRGESGVGKELIARATNAASSRRNQPFIKVNCAALPAELLESELFGHEKGAFTGAYRRKSGKFELAEGGTIFLDEIGEIPVGLQAKLLHVLQDHEFSRVGGSELIRVDVRVITSTNRNLEAAVRSGHFREDLYYRLKVVTLSVPPLRERPEEIPILAEIFVERFNAQYNRRLSLRPESLRLLSRYSWPGNVRELENMIKRIVVLQDELLLQEELATLSENSTVSGNPIPSKEPADVSRVQSLKEIARRAALAAEREVILRMLEQVQWNRAAAARALNIGYKAFLYKLDQCGLARKQAGSAPRRPLAKALGQGTEGLEVGKTSERSRGRTARQPDGLRLPMDESGLPEPPGASGRP